MAIKPPQKMGIRVLCTLGPRVTQFYSVTKRHVKFHSQIKGYVKSAHLRTADHKTWTFENILGEVMVAGRVCCVFTGHQQTAKFCKFHWIVAVQSQTTVFVRNTRRAVRSAEHTVRAGRRETQRRHHWRHFS